MTSNNILSKDAATAAIQRINHRRVPTDLSRVNIDPSIDSTGNIALTLEAEGRRFSLTDASERGLLRACGVSRKFLNSLGTDLDLASRALNRARLADNPKGGAITISTIGADMVDAISYTGKAETMSLTLGDAWSALKDLDALTAVADISHLGKGRFDLRTLSDFAETPSRNVGDIVRAGVKLSLNGPTASVNPYSYRLVCANGAQRVEEGDVMVIDLTDPLDSLRVNFTKALELSRSFTRDFVRTDEIVVPNPHEYVMRALRIAGANNNLRTNVVDRIVQEAPNRTLYEILNIVTAIGRESAGDSPAKRNRIEAVAGRVTSMQGGHTRCAKCDSTVA